MAVPARSSCEGMKLKQSSTGKTGTPTVAKPQQHSRRDAIHVTSQNISQMLQSTKRDYHSGTTISAKVKHLGDTRALKTEERHHVPKIKKATASAVFSRQRKQDFHLPDASGWSFQLAPDRTALDPREETQLLREGGSRTSPATGTAALRSPPKPKPGIPCARTT